MTLTVKHLKGQTFSEPMVIFPLKQYENLLEYVEDLEDRQGKRMNILRLGFHVRGSYF